MNPSDRLTRTEPTPTPAPASTPARAVGPRRRSRRARWGMRPDFDAMETRALLTTIVVNSPDDVVAEDGVVTLREAILSLNAGAPINADVVGAGDAFGTNDRIHFNLPVGGTRIQPRTPLPAITTPVFIDGFSQPGSSPNTLPVGNNSTVVVEINGALQVDGSGNPTGNGLVLNTGNSTVRGLAINGFTENAPRRGIALVVTGEGGVNASNNHIYGNWIGLGTDGDTPIPNTIGITARDDLTVGQPAGTVSNNVIGRRLGHVAAAPSNRPDLVFNEYSERNVISSSYLRAGISSGVIVSGLGATNNIVAGNYIGTNFDGTQVSSNLNNLFGVRIQLGASQNFVGFSPGATAADAVAVRNVIAADGNGVIVNPTNGQVQATSDSGVLIVDGGTRNNVVAGNYIGARTDGTIGGFGHSQAGVGIQTLSRVAGFATANPFDNLIGSNLDGVNDNLEANLIVDSTAGAGVVLKIAAAGLQGDPGPSGNRIQNNAILENRFRGVVLTQGSNGNVVARNTIRDNGLDGIAVGRPGEVDSFNNTFTANSIFNNTGLGIDLYNAGAGDGESVPTLNDAGDLDRGNNGLVNFPTLGSAINNGLNTVVQGVYSARANATYRLEFFSSPTGDPSGFGEGETYLGFLDVTTDGSGNAPFTANLPVVAAGAVITATATNLAGGDSQELNSTSEFSSPVAVRFPDLPSISIDNATVFEGETLVFTITLSAPTGQVVSVQYASQDVTATSPTDYQGGAGTVTFQPGETQKTILFTSVLDAVFEPDETFNVVLSNPVNGVVATPFGVGTILDVPIVSINDVTVTEGVDANAVLTVSLSRPARQGGILVAFATADGTAIAGIDYVATAGQLFFAEGQQSQTITVPIIDDAVFEATETFLVNLDIVEGRGVFGDPQGTVTILDNDQPSAQPSMSINDVTVTEGVDPTATLTVTLSAPAPAGGVFVDYATADGTAIAGVDYVATAGTLFIPAGQTSGTISIVILDDNISEPTEVFFVNLSNPVNAEIVKGVGTVTILDNDPLTRIPPIVTSVFRIGFHNQPTFISVLFDQPMDPAQASDPTNYVLISAGRDQRFGTRDDRVFTFTSAVVSPDGAGVTLVPAPGRLPLHRRYQIIVNGSDQNALRSAETGLILDGDRDGIPGGDYTQILAPRRDTANLPPHFRPRAAGQAAPAPQRAGAANVKARPMANASRKITGTVPRGPMALNQGGPLGNAQHRGPLKLNVNNPNNNPWRI